MENCSFLPLVCHWAIAWEEASLPQLFPTLCKPLAILRTTFNPPLLIVLDAASLLPVRPVQFPTVSPRAIVCRLRELSISAPEPPERPMSGSPLAGRNWRPRLPPPHNRKRGLYPENALVPILDGWTLFPTPCFPVPPGYGRLRPVLSPLFPACGRSPKSARRPASAGESRCHQKARTPGACFHYCAARFGALRRPTRRQYSVGGAQESEADKIPHLIGTGRSHPRRQPRPQGSLPQIRRADRHPRNSGSAHCRENGAGGKRF